MWVRFLRNFDWYPPEGMGRFHIAYKAGMIELVRRKCGEEAIAAGAAVSTERKTENECHID